LSFPLRVFNGILSANLRYDIVRCIEILKLFCRTALIVWVVKKGYGLLGVALITSVTTLFFGGLLIYCAYKEEKGLSISPQNFRKERIKSFFGYSIYVFLGRIADTLKFQIDSLVITRFLSLALVTHYGVALRLVEYFMSFMSSITSVVTPVFSQEEGKNDYDSIREKFRFTSKITLNLSAFMGIMAMFYAHPFIGVWLGEEFLDAYIPLVILTGAGIFSLGQNPIVSVLYGISKHKVLMYLFFAEGVLNLILSVSFVQLWGIKGVALGTMVPMLINYLVCLPIYICRVLSLNLMHYYQSVLVVFLKAAIPLSLIGFALKGLVEENFLRIGIIASVHSVIYLSVIIFVGFEKTEREYLISKIRGR
jgi:O-antigen/teichoic acid export membrane protein